MIFKMPFRKAPEVTVRRFIGEFDIKTGERLLVRRMTLADVPTVHELEHLIFPDPWTESNFRSEILHTQISFPIVAILHKEIVGYSVSWFVGDEVHIANVAVSPIYRRIGIGEILLRCIMEEGYRRGVTRAFLEVRRSNTAAIKLYEKFGFRRIGLRAHYYRNGEDAVLMEKIIPGEHRFPGTFKDLEE